MPPGAEGRRPRIDRALAALAAPDPARPRGRVAALVDALHVVPDRAAADALIGRMLGAEEMLRIGFLNAHAVNMAWRDPAAAAAFGGLDLILRDGIGMELLLRRQGRDPGLNMNGTDLIPAILAAGRDRPLAIYGTEDPWLSRAAERLSAEGHAIVDTCHGFAGTEEYAARHARHPAGIVLLAMGMPKQERVARALSPAAGRGTESRRGSEPKRAALVLCGGAIVDFLSRRHRRAPAWMRRHKVEWMFRLASEPRRLFGRYIIGNAAFVWRTALLPGRAPSRAAARFLTWAQGGSRPAGGRPAGRP